MKYFRLFIVSVCIVHCSCGVGDPVGADGKYDRFAHIPTCPLPPIEGTWVITAYYLDYCAAGALSDSVLAVGSLEIIKDTAQYSFLIKVCFRDTSYRFNQWIVPSNPTLRCFLDEKLDLTIYFHSNSSFDGTTLTCEPVQPFGTIATFLNDDGYFPRCGEVAGYQGPVSVFGVKLTRPIE